MGAKAIHTTQRIYVTAASTCTIASEEAASLALLPRVFINYYREWICDQTKSTEIGEKNHRVLSNAVHAGGAVICVVTASSGGGRELDFRSWKRKGHSPDGVDFVVLTSLDAQVVQLEVDGDGTRTLFDAHLLQHQWVQGRYPKRPDAWNKI